MEAGVCTDGGVGPPIATSTINSTEGKGRGNGWEEKGEAGTAQVLTLGELAVCTLKRAVNTLR